MPKTPTTRSPNSFTVHPAMNADTLLSCAHENGIKHAHTPKNMRSSPERNHACASSGWQPPFRAVHAHHGLPRQPEHNCTCRCGGCRRWCGWTRVRCPYSRGTARLPHHRGRWQPAACTPGILLPAHNTRPAYLCYYTGHDGVLRPGRVVSDAGRPCHAFPRYAGARPDVLCGFVVGFPRTHTQS